MTCHHTTYGIVSRKPELVRRLYHAASEPDHFDTGGLRKLWQGPFSLRERRRSRILKCMEVQFTPETEKKLKDLSAQSGRGTDDLVEDATAAYVDELLQAREMLNSRYDDLKSGRVKPID